MKNFLNIFRKKRSSGVFIPSGEGYAELIADDLHTSTNGIARHLGYHADQIHTFRGDLNLKNKIVAVSFEIFSKTIVFIQTKPEVTRLKTNRVQSFLSDFNFEEEYNSLNIRDILLEGIRNKTFTIEFLSKVLNFSPLSPNENFYATDLGVHLFFVNGILASFKFDNDLNEWARYFQEINPQIITNYAKASKRYWGENYDQIFKEVNVQCSALAQLPQMHKNEFIQLHQAEFDTINYKMLLVCHHNEEISLTDFLELNHGRIKELSSRDQGTRTFELGLFKYQFGQNGNLIQASGVL